jgi:hypothetical protein
MLDPDQGPAPRGLGRQDVPAKDIVRVPSFSPARASTYLRRGPIVPLHAAGSRSLTSHGQELADRLPRRACCARIGGSLRGLDGCGAGACRCRLSACRPRPCASPRRVPDDAGAGCRPTLGDKMRLAAQAATSADGAGLVPPSAHQRDGPETRPARGRAKPRARSFVPGPPSDDCLRHHPHQRLRLARAAAGSRMTVCARGADGKFILI